MSIYIMDTTFLSFSNHQNKHCGKYALLNMAKISLSDLIKKNSDKLSIKKVFHYLIQTTIYYALCKSLL